MQLSLDFLLICGLLASTGTALPSQGHVQKRAFKVERVANPAFKGKNGVIALKKAYTKYGWVVPENVAAAADKAAGGVSAISLGDILGDAQKAKGAKGKGKAGAAAAAAAAGAGAGTAAGEAEAAKASTTSATAEATAAKGTAKGTKTSAAAKATAASTSSNATISAGNSTSASGTGNNKQGGLVAAVPEANDVEYLSPVIIGGQTLNLDFDSGSSDLWVYSSLQAAAESKGHSIFDSTKSKTFKNLTGASWKISYGDGSGAAGLVGTDTVEIGGVTMTGQAIELATAVSASFQQDINNDGLVGLAFSKLNTVKPQQQKTFFDNVAPTLPEALFSADLRSGQAGSYEFGRVDAAKFTGPLTSIPVNTTLGFWQFSSAGFAIDSGNGSAIQPIKTATVQQAIADTGTTLLLTSPEIAQAYYAQAPGAVLDQQAGGFTVPCQAKLPDLLLDVGGGLYTARIKGDDINFAPVAKGSTTCFGGVQPAPAGVPVLIWGDIFFKSQFVVFNSGNNTLSMAPHVIPGVAAGAATAAGASNQARSIFTFR